MVARVWRILFAECDFVDVNIYDFGADCDVGGEARGDLVLVR